MAASSLQGKLVFVRPTYLDGPAEAEVHADQNVPLKNYYTGLLLPGERKSVEPMTALTARLALDNVGRMHQSLEGATQIKLSWDARRAFAIFSSAAPLLQRWT